MSRLTLLPLLALAACSRGPAPIELLNSTGKDDGFALSAPIDASRDSLTLSMTCDAPGGCDLTMTLSASSIVLPADKQGSEQIFEMALGDFRPAGLVKLMVDSRLALYYEKATEWDKFGPLLVPMDSYGRAYAVKLEAGTVPRGTTQFTVRRLGDAITSFVIDLRAEWMPHPLPPAPDGGEVDGGTSEIDGGTSEIDGGSSEIDLSSASPD